MDDLLEAKYIEPVKADKAKEEVKAEPKEEAEAKTEKAPRKKKN